MVEPLTIFVLFSLYIILLLALAMRAQNGTGLRGRVERSGLVYSLSLAVYCTAWSYYGSVGLATSSGFLFSAVYLGPVLGAFLWGFILPRMIRIKNDQRITSIADLISARYGKSQTVAVVVTVIILLGILPYIALQLKAMIQSFILVTSHSAAMPRTGANPGVEIVLLLLLVFFTIAVGARRLVPAERHPGIVLAVAVMSAIKLLAFIVLGVFVVWVLYDGPVELIARCEESAWAGGVFAAPDPGVWVSYLVVCMVSFIVLPRQFHLAVVENSDEGHVRSAMWQVPLYLFLFILPVIPIAVAGRLQGIALSAADNYVLELPMLFSGQAMTLVVLFGGLSASVAMVVVTSMTVSTMVTNHMLLPLLGRVRALGRGRVRVLAVRRIGIASIIAVAYGLDISLINRIMLSNMGLISMCGVLQIAPALLVGLFWRKASKAGALAGICSGFLVWLWMLVLPVVSFHVSPADTWFLDLAGTGPVVETMNRQLPFMISHAVFWSLAVNVGLMVTVSLLFPASAFEQSRADSFLMAADQGVRTEGRGERTYEDSVDADPKKQELRELLIQYFSERETDSFIESITLGYGDKINIIELLEWHDAAETFLAGAVGAATAHSVMRGGLVYSNEERMALSRAYSRMLAALNVSPLELKKKVDYFHEREMLLLRQAEELEQKVEELNAEIAEKEKAQRALEREKKFSIRLVQSTPSFFVAFDRRGRIEMMNSSMLRALGYKAGQVVGADYLTTLFPQQARRNVSALMKMLFEFGIPVTMQQRMKTREGREILVEWHCTAMAGDGEESYYMGYGIDVSESNEASRRQHLALRVLETLNSASDEEDTVEQILRMIWRFTRMEAAGIRLREDDRFPFYRAIGLPASSLEDVGPDESALGSMVLQVDSGRADPQCFTDGGSFWTPDLTEHLEHHGDEPCGEWFNREGAAKRFRSLALIPIRSREGITGLLQLADSRKDRLDYEMILFFEGLGSSIGIALQRLQAVEEIRQLNEELEQRVRERTRELEEANRELESFSYSVSHDLRTPLRHIRGYAELLAGELTEEDRLRHYAEVMDEAAEKMARMIDDVLAFSRLGRRKIRAVETSLSEVVEDARAELHEFARGRGVEWEIDESLPTVYADPALLRLVVVNLLSNALKYTRPREVARIRIGAREEHGQAGLTVEDNGVGFDPKYKDRLFMVFQRLHAEADFEGTGVGLANVDRIIRKHGGRLGADSVRDRGATFWFTLPVAGNSESAE